jgi:hypothetical protein
MDAALVRVTDPTTIDPWFSEVEASRVADGLELPTDYAIYTPRGKLKADFLGQAFDISLAYGSGVTVRIRTVYESVCETLEGDSGSPLIAGDGTLFGMHFYGDVRQVGGVQRKISLALPAYMIFRDGVFAERIELAT